MASLKTYKDHVKHDAVEWFKFWHKFRGRTWWMKFMYGSRYYGRRP